MVRRTEAVPTEVMDVLRITDRTLGSVIASIIGVPPGLTVVGQWRVEPPHPSWVAPPLSSHSALLSRCTGYRNGEDELSHNISYVDLSRVDPEIARQLESEELNLGQLFLSDDIEKFGFEFGTDAEAGEIGATLRSRLDGIATDLSPYVWRRYLASIDGSVVFVVIESLPTRTWARILASLSAHGGRVGEA